MSNGQKLQLLSNASATGSAFTWFGGDGVFVVEGTIAVDSSVSLEFQTPQGTWISVSDQTVLFQNAKGDFQLPGAQVRAAVTGTVSGVYAYVVRM